MKDTVSQLIADLAKSYEKGVITSAADLEFIRRIPSSIPMINFISGGGCPVNRIVEFYGDYSSLKSYTAYDMIANFQRFDWANNESNAIVSVEWKPKKIKVGKKEDQEELVIMEYASHKLRRGYAPVKESELKRVALIDIEGTYDKEWGSTFGIDNEGLLLIKPDALSEAVDVAEALLSDPGISLVVIDSMSAIGADAEVDASMENEQMAINARFWNKATRKLQNAMNRNPQGHVTLIVINSSYEKVGFVMGDPEKVKNGSQMKFAKSLSIRFRALKELKGKDEEGNETTVGRNISIKCMKNKTARPFLDGTFYFSYHDDGLVKGGKTDIHAQILDLAARFSLTDRSGAWFSYDGVKAAGQAKFLEQLIEAKKFDKLQKEVYAKIVEKHAKS